ALARSGPDAPVAAGRRGCAQRGGAVEQLDRDAGLGGAGGGGPCIVGDVVGIGDAGVVGIAHVRRGDSRRAGVLDEGRGVRRTPDIVHIFAVYEDRVSALRQPTELAGCERLAHVDILAGEAATHGRAGAIRADDVDEELCGRDVDGAGAGFLDV